jgi:hypothetical protein
MVTRQNNDDDDDDDNNNNNNNNKKGNVIQPVAKTSTYTGKHTIERRGQT